MADAGVALAAVRHAQHRLELRRQLLPASREPGVPRGRARALRAVPALPRRARRIGDPAAGADLLPGGILARPRPFRRRGGGMVGRAEPGRPRALHQRCARAETGAPRRGGGGGGGRGGRGERVEAPDWEYLLQGLGLTTWDHLLARLAHLGGLLVMAAALAWAAIELRRENQGGRVAGGAGARRG